jgi:acyl carrier protein
MSADVRRALSEVVVEVTGCDPAGLVPEASLTELGIDSLALVEISDELGRRIGGYLTDESLAGVRTLGDLARAAAANLETVAPAWVRQADLVRAEWNPVSNRTVIRRTNDAAGAPASVVGTRRLGTSMAIVGAVTGVLLGFAAVASALILGLPRFDMPPLTGDKTPAASPSESARQTATASPTATGEAKRASLTASPQRVTAGDRFGLTGAIPTATEGTLLQIQRRDASSGWSDFPVTATAREGGRFSAEIYQQHTGSYRFRLRDSTTGTTTPEVTVEFVAD